MRKVLLTGLCAALILATNAVAGVPNEMNFQGILTDGDGNPVASAVYYMRFRIYDYPTNGDVLWESDELDDKYVPVTVEDGLYNHLLGSSNPLPDSLAAFDSLWLGVMVGHADPEMIPRTKLVSVMYAMKTFVAETALRADSATFATSASHADSAGNAQSSLYSDTAQFSYSSERSDSASHAIIADTAKYGRYGDYRLIASDQTPFSHDDVDWALAGLVPIPPGDVWDFVYVEMVFKAHSPTPEFSPRFELRIGEDGLETVKLNRTYFVSATYITAYSTHSYYYQPSPSEKANGFDIEVYVSVTEAGGPWYSQLETLHVFGK